MFDFCKLDVYQKAKAFCILIKKTILSGNFDSTTNDQLRRASFSIMLNIAEGTSRFSNKDRKNFMVIARGSAFECAAIISLSHSHFVTGVATITLKKMSFLEELRPRIYLMVAQPNFL